MFHVIRSWRAAIIGAVFVVCAVAAPPLTQIQDTIYNADGSLFSGVVEISWPAFTASDGSIIGAQTLNVSVTNGFLNVSLTPTTTALTPASYSVVFISGGRNQSTAAWAVPPSTTPVRIQDIQTASNQSTNSGSLQNTPIAIGDVTGLSQELSLRLQQGPSFALGRSAVIDSQGEIDGASGNASDCLHVDGSSAPCGEGGSSLTLSFSDHETPSGAMNGANATFSLGNAPSPAASLNLFRNGMLLNPATDYSLNGNQVTFSANQIPQSSDVLDASYRYGANNSGLNFADNETPSGAANGANDVFTLAQAPNPLSSLRLYRNGLAMKPGVDYTISGNSITFLSVSTPQIGDVLLAFYRH